MRSLRHLLAVRGDLGGSETGAAVMARVSAALLGAGATLVLAWTALPGEGGGNDGAMVVLALLTYALAALVLGGGTRLPLWTFELVAACGTVLVTAVLELGQQGASAYVLFYLWIALCAAYFFPWRRALLQIVFIGVAYASLQLLGGHPGVSSSQTVGSALVVAGTLAVAAVLVVFLKRRLETLLERTRAQNERLRELDRLKDDFVASVSHELRTPLTSIRGYLELIRDGDAGDLTEDQATFIEIVDRNSVRLLRLVNDLLDVARVDDRGLELLRAPCDLAGLVAEAFERAQPYAEERAIAVACSSDSPAWVDGDAARLAQVVDNLLSNAVKFTTAGGRADVVVQSTGGSVSLSVEDNGIGIPQAERERVFERFFRSSTASTQAVQGTGLGLWITRAIVLAHGGSIACESREGAGTRFVVALPATTAPGDDREALPTALSAGSGSRSLGPSRPAPAPAPPG